MSQTYYAPSKEPTCHLFLGGIPEVKKRLGIQITSAGSSDCDDDNNMVKKTIVAVLENENRSGATSNTAEVKILGVYAIATFVTENEATAARELLVSYKDGFFPKVTFACEKQKIENSTKTVPHSAYSIKNLPFIPKGLIIEENFISEEEEKGLHDFISVKNAEKFDTSIKRRVQHYGFRFDYQSLKASDKKLAEEKSKVEIIPEELLGIFKCADEVNGASKSENDYTTPRSYNQVTVNEYHPGIGIAAHCETHSCFHDGFCSVSLLGGIVMDFTFEGEVDANVDKAGAIEELKSVTERNDQFRDTTSNTELDLSMKKISIFLPPRSRITCTKESRFNWRHGIASRNTDNVDGKIRPRDFRLSLTYRCVKAEPFCDCKWKKLCDFQNPECMQLPDRIKTVEELQKRREELTLKQKQGGS